MPEAILDAPDEMMATPRESPGIERREVTTALPHFLYPVTPPLLIQQPVETKGRSWNWYVILALGVGLIFGAVVTVILLLLLIKM